MSMGGQERDRPALRMEIRILCYEAAVALEKGRGLGDLRPRSLRKKIEAARHELFRVLENEWSGGRQTEGKSTVSEINLYQLFISIMPGRPETGCGLVCRFGALQGGHSDTFLLVR